MSPPRLPLTRPAPFALSGSELVIGYLLLVLTPLMLAWREAPSGAGFASELAGGLAFVGYAMLLAQFVLTGRFRIIGGRIGIDVVLRLHQALARLLTLFLLLHPFIYGVTRLWSDPAAYVAALAQLFTTPAFASGIIAWVGLMVLMVLALKRTALALSYEAWRASHGFLALVIAVAGWHHAVSVGGLSAAPSLRAAWLVLAALAAATLARAYILHPLMQRRRPWRVAEVRALGPGRWLLAIETAGKQLDFRAGQFVWLKLGPHPFTLHENPFSIVSAPQDGRLEFLIREAGDFTSAIGAVAPGTPAWIDGPYGAFTLDAAPRARRIVMLAGGVGLAPCLGMLREAAACGDGRAFHLVFANRTQSQIVFRDEIAALATHLDLRIDFILSEPPAGWNGATGQMDGATLLPLLAGARNNQEETAYFLCGPPPMVGAATDALAAMGVPPRNVITEKFDYD